MGNLKISELSSTSIMNSDDSLIISRGNENKKISYYDFNSQISGGGGNLLNYDLYASASIGQNSDAIKFENNGITLTYPEGTYFNEYYSSIFTWNRDAYGLEANDYIDRVLEPRVYLKTGETIKLSTIITDSNPNGHMIIFVYPLGDNQFIATTSVSTYSLHQGLNELSYTATEDCSILFRVGVGNVKGSTIHFTDIMLTKGNGIDVSTYKPYAMSNVELTDMYENHTCTNEEIRHVGARNLIPFPKLINDSLTINGTTYYTDDEGVIHISGTPTIDRTDHFIHNDLGGEYLQKGFYTLEIFLSEPVDCIMVGASTNKAWFTVAGRPTNPDLAAMQSPSTYYRCESNMYYDGTTPISWWIITACTDVNGNQVTFNDLQLRIQLKDASVKDKTWFSPAMSNYALSREVNMYLDTHYARSGNKFLNAAKHNNILHTPVDLTNKITDGSLYTEIANGDFTNIYPGDYFYMDLPVMGSYSNAIVRINFTIFDLDYYWMRLNYHHIVCMASRGIFSSTWGSTVSNGYAGSDIHTLLNNENDVILPAFKEMFGDHLGQMSDYLSTSADNDGKPSNYQVQNFYLRLPNCMQLFGFDILGDKSYINTGLSTFQLAYFKLAPRLAYNITTNCWNSSMYSTNKVGFSSFGVLTPKDPTQSSNVNPLFILK